MTTVVMMQWMALVAHPWLAAGQTTAPSPHATSRPAGRAVERAELTRACGRTSEALRDKLGPGYPIVVDPPFVLAGDLPDERLARYGRGVVRHAAEAMWRRYFDKRPTDPITILLFRSEKSYRDHAKRLYGDAEVAYYGYYKPDIRTLLMNISTGGGTLIHELTHALIAYDFPSVPEWFNEGLASLHEQCNGEAWKRGELVGDVNWRLPALQAAIASKRLRPLRKLMTADDFRGPQETLNYAQARYFCMYLQKRGELARFYRAFRGGHADDPTGLSHVEEVLGRRRIEVIEQEFLAWVVQLHCQP